jgi:hypothetical protein
MSGSLPATHHCVIAPTGQRRDRFLKSNAVS